MGAVQLSPVRRTLMGQGEMTTQHDLKRRGEHVSSTRRAVIGAALLLLASPLVGCVVQEERRGHLFVASDLQQIQPGMTQDQVRGVLGTPDTTSTVGNQAFYYISSTAKGAAFLEATEVDRQILAVYFTPAGTVQQMANYSMKDGKVIDIIGRETQSAQGDRSLIEKLFKGVGKKQKVFDDTKG